MRRQAVWGVRTSSAGRRMNNHQRVHHLLALIQCDRRVTRARLARDRLHGRVGWPIIFLLGGGRRETVQGTVSLREILLINTRSLSREAVRGDNVSRGLVAHVELRCRVLLRAIQLVEGVVSRAEHGLTAAVRHLKRVHLRVHRRRRQRVRAIRVPLVRRVRVRQRPVWQTGEARVALEGTVALHDDHWPLRHHPLAV
jgi:hypothetical protein